MPTDNNTTSVGGVTETPEPTIIEPIAHSTQNFPLESTTDKPTVADNTAKKVVQRVDEQKKNDKLVAEADWLHNDDGSFGIGRKWDAYSKSWDDTWIARGIDDYAYNEKYDDIEDPQFMKEWTDEAIEETLVANKLGLNMYQRLKQAKNIEHKQKLIQWALKDKERHIFIDQALDAYGGVLTEKSIAAVSTGFLDVDLPISMMGGIGYKVLTAAKVNSARAIMMGSAAGSHGIAAKYIFESANGELSASETTLFGLMGAGFDAWAVSRFKSNAKKPDGDAAANAPSNDELANAADADKKQREADADSTQPLNDAQEKHRAETDAENQKLIDEHNAELKAVNESEISAAEKETQRLAINEKYDKTYQTKNAEYNKRQDELADTDEYAADMKKLEDDYASDRAASNKAFDDGKITQEEFYARNEANGKKYDQRKAEIEDANVKKKSDPDEPNAKEPNRDATTEEIHDFLVPREGSGSYTQYNIREEAKAARKYGKGTPAYNKRMKDIAYGKYQHMGATTRAIAKKTGKSVEWLRTPNGQEFAQKFLIEDNIKSMKKDGVKVTPANYYAYHQLGAPRAKRLFKGKLTAKDYKVLYDQLGRKAQARAKGNPNVILKEWKKAYAKGGHIPSSKKQMRQVDVDIDNVNKRRKQDEGETDPKKRKDKFKKTDEELAVLNKKKKDLDTEINKQKHDDLINERTQKDYRQMADDFAQNIVEYKAMIKKALKEGDTKTIDDLGKIVDDLYEGGFIKKGDYEQYKNSLKGGKFEPPKLDVTQNADGTFSMNKNTEGKGGKKNKGKKLAVASLLGIAFTSEAMAGDGGGEAFTGLLLGAVALFGGAAAIKNFGSMKNGVGAAMNKAKTFARTRGLRATVDEMIGSLSTSLNETLKPLTKDRNKEFTDFVKKVLWDFENGDNLTVERNKAAIFHGLSAALHKGNDLAYQNWLKETGVSKLKAATSNLSFNQMSKRMEFEIQVMEYVEQGKHGGSAAVKEAGDNTKAVIANLRQQAIDAGVKKADEMFDIKNYMPRYFRGNEMAVMFRDLDAVNQKSFIDQLAKMFVGKDGDMVKATQKADDYFNMMIKVGETRQRFTNIKEIEDFLANNNLTHLKADNVASDLGIGTSQAGRTKTRIYMDKKKFETIRVKDMDGNDVSLELNDIFVNNAVEATDRLLNNMSGHVALADAGFASIDDAINEARKGSPDNAKVMEDIVNMLTGSPILDVGTAAAKTLETIGNLTVAAKMPLSVISLTQEFFNTLVKSRGGIWQEMMRESVNVFKKHGTSSAIVDELTSFMGQGQHKTSASYGAFGHIAEGIDNTSSNTKGGLNKLSQIGRDTVLYNLGLVPVSDFLTRINLVDSASFLHDVVHGMKKMDDRMKNTIGLTPQMEQMLKGKLTKSGGELQKMDIDKWGRADQLAFRKVIDNMMQKRIQQATVGGTPHWGRNNTYGIVATQLLKFPLQAFTNHGIYDLKGVAVHGDPRSMASMFAWFSGGYAASMLRSEVKGQTKTDEEHLMNAMLSMPIIGGLEGIYNSFTDAPAMLSTMAGFHKGMQDTVSAIGD